MDGNAADKRAHEKKLADFIRAIRKQEAENDEATKRLVAALNLGKK